MTWLRNRVQYLQSSLEARPKLKKVMDSIVWLLLDKLLRMFVGIVIGIWLLRYLAPERFGMYSAALSFTALFAIVSSLGLRRVVVRELIKFPQQKTEILGSAFTLMSISGCSFWVICTLCGAWYFHDDNILFYLVSIMSLRFIFQAFEPIIHFFEAQTELKYTVYATNAAYFFSNLCKISLILFEADLLAFAMLFVFDGLLTALSLIFIFRKRGYQLSSWKYSSKIAKGLLRDSAPLIFAGVMITVNAKIDQLMLREMVNDTEVGLYAAAYRLVEILFFVPNVIKQSIFPNILEEYKRNTRQFYLKLENVLTLLYAFSYVAILSILLFSDFLIPILLGEDYLESVTAFKILSVLVLFISINVVKNSYLIIHNWTRLKLVFSIIAAATNVVANLILIPKYGMIGACYASLLSYGISAYFATWFFPDLWKLNRLMTRSLFLLRIRKIFN